MFLFPYCNIIIAIIKTLQNIHRHTKIRSGTEWVYHICLLEAFTSSFAIEGGRAEEVWYCIKSQITGFSILSADLAERAVHMLVSEGSLLPSPQDSKTSSRAPRIQPQPAVCFHPSHSRWEREAARPCAGREPCAMVTHVGTHVLLSEGCTCPTPRVQQVPHAASVLGSMDGCGSARKESQTKDVFATEVQGPGPADRRSSNPVLNHWADSLLGHFPKIAARSFPFFFFHPKAPNYAPKHCSKYFFPNSSDI